jgi:hypothetical protein
MEKIANGAVIYRGPSMLDGSPIVVVATGLAGKSRNEKTGSLVQTWIIRDDMTPQAAVKSGADASICGDCPHRGTIEDGRNVGRSCYVTVHQAPLSVFKAFHRGIYLTVGRAELAALGRGRKVRLGSYGDPAAVPLWVWSDLMSEADAGTGYTHQWRRFPELAQWCMASCDSATDRFHAKVLGFRTFRVRGEDDATAKGEVICPASAEAGKKTVCASCLACGGTSAKARADIVIVAHGGAGVRANYRARIVAPSPSIAA